MEFDYIKAMKLSNQLCFPLYAAARKITSLYTPLLKECGLTYTQYIVLMTLWEKDGLSVSEIGQRLLLDNGTLSPLLKKMEQKGYIIRQRGSTDDRVIIVTLTDAGRTLQKQLKFVPKEIANCVDFPHDKIIQLKELLNDFLKK
ncbi:MAG: MarR family transcriptional regulator [Eubacteriales bacterium]|nr:MarR family transcriptional regulator [Eubacteriales bacterium]